MWADEFSAQLGYPFKSTNLSIPLFAVRHYNGFSIVELLCEKAVVSATEP
jgi:hypothetical protein